MPRLSHVEIDDYRDQGYTWPQIAQIDGRAASTLRGAYSRRQGDSQGSTSRSEPSAAPHEEERTVVLSGKADKRITSLAELYEFFEIPYHMIHADDCAVAGERMPDNAICECGGTPYSDEYEVISFTVKGNSWDVSMKDPKNPRDPIVSTNYQYEVKAYLRPRQELENREVIQGIWDDLREDAAEHVPYQRLEAPSLILAADEPTQLLELFLADPHLGMLAWGKELGIPYDLDIGLQDYEDAFERLLGYRNIYNVGRILYVVGNDLFHVDGPSFDVKGNSRGGATTKGTSQDFDTRLQRMFTKIRRLIVQCVERAASVAPVTIQMVPGNHDRQTVYKFGEVLGAWFRHEIEAGLIELNNSPNVRSYWGYGANTFMFTHGEEFKRKRDNLATIFATECPAELWVEGKVREIHVGHNHINRQKIWTGEALDEVWEGRAIRVRSLPAITPEDSWHHESGYKHQRRATVMAWRESGGMDGYHEVLI